MRELDRCKACTGDMDCGGFYGRVRPLVTPISTPFRRTSDTSTLMASGSTSMGDVAELFSRDLADGCLAIQDMSRIQIHLHVF